VLEMSEVQAAARKVGVDIKLLEIRRAADIAPAFQALREGVQALYVCPSALVNANYARINTFALGARLPAFHAHAARRRGHLATYGARTAGCGAADRGAYGSCRRRPRSEGRARRIPRRSCKTRMGRGPDHPYRLSFCGRQSRAVFSLGERAGRAPFRIDLC